MPEAHRQPDQGQHRWDVFLCHSHQDKAQVLEPLSRALDAAGISYWYDQQQIPWGASLIKSIGEGLQTSRYVVVVLSPSFLRTTWGRHELDTAFALEAKSRTSKILPLILGSQEERGEIFDSFPLLSARRYLVWEGDAQQVVSELRALLENRPMIQEVRRKFSRLTYLLGILLLTLLATFGKVGEELWREAFPDVPALSGIEESLETDRRALELLAEALVQIENDQFEDAYQSVVEAEKIAQTALARNRGASLRLLLAQSMSEGHQMVGEVLVEGQRVAREAEKLRYSELAVTEGMLAFKWAKRTADAMSTLSSQDLPEIRFSKIKLSNPLGDKATTGMQARQRLEQGKGALSGADIADATRVTTAQVLRFYVAKAFHPEATSSEVVSRDLWSGVVRWSPDLAGALHNHFVKMSSKGVQMVRTIQAQPKEVQFSVGRSFGLDEDLDFKFCYSLLQNLRRFLGAMQAKASPGREVAQATVLAQDVDRRLLDMVPLLGKNP